MDKRVVIIAPAHPTSSPRHPRAAQRSRGPSIAALAVLLLLLPACASVPAATPTLEARWSVASEPLIVRSEPGFAGAVSSIRFRGTEFLDSADHGRLLQGAISFEGLGECDNPTLAGASSDPRGRSTSRLLAAAAGPDRWATVTRMAYWLRPGQNCTAADGVRRPAANRTALSDVLYQQTLTPGWGAPNAVHAAIAITTERTRSRAVVEVLTAYVPPSFSAAYLFNGERLVSDEAASPRSGEQDRPAVLATADGRSAIGLLSLAGEAPPRYGRVLLPEVGKLNIAHRPAQAYAAGPHPYRCALIIGSLQEVETALRTLVGRSAAAL